MAVGITADNVELLQTQSKAEEDTKRAEQELEGKGFVNNGQGVIPEEIWKNLPGKTERE